MEQRRLPYTYTSLIFKQGETRLTSEIPVSIPDLSMIPYHENVNADSRLRYCQLILSAISVLGR